MTNKNFRISILSIFYIALVLHGLQRMPGLFIIELSKIKNMTPQDAAVPFIYCWAVSKIVGSFSGFMTDHKSSEMVVFCGALLCIIGAALCILDTDITTIVVFWGFIFGSGYGFASPHLRRDPYGFKFLSTVDSNKLEVFQEMSTSFGICIMPFIVNALFFHYGLQGSFIMCSGIMLQYIPFALASIYNIEMRIPNIKWRVRKKSTQYSVNEQKGRKTTSVESFNNSLEPDFILKGIENDNYFLKIKIDSSATASNKNFYARRKRSETKSSDLQSFEINRKILQNHESSIPEKKSCKKKIGKICEENISNVCVIDVGLECKGSEKVRDLTFERANNTFILDKSSLNSKHDVKLKCEISKDIYQNEINDTEQKEKELNDKFSENNIVKNQSVSAHTCIENASIIHTDDFKDHKKHKVRENIENEQRISFNLGQEKTSSLTSYKIQPETLLGKEIPILSPHLLQNVPSITIPEDIKIHVEEFTFTVDSGYRGSFDSNYSEDRISEEYSEDRINDEINNSDSRTLQEDKCANCSSPNLPRNVPKDFDSKSNPPKLSPLSNKSESNRNIFFGKINKPKVLNLNKNELKLKFIKILKFFSILMSPVCSCIVMFTMIFETTLIILLTNIGDFVNSSDRIYDEFQCILVAFGVGGLFGKLCCYKISTTISEKSHSFGVVLFLLNGLAIAGVLYSPNQSWMAAFYSILGALEGGISYILPKLILEYTDKQVHHVISSMQSFFSGVAVICLPSVMGLLPEEMDDYEFLLQTVSCLSVLCALLAYFLPYLRSIPNKRNNPVPEKNGSNINS